MRCLWIVKKESLNFAIFDNRYDESTLHQHHSFVIALNSVAKHSHLHHHQFFVRSHVYLYCLHVSILFLLCRLPIDFEHKKSAAKLGDFSPYGTKSTLFSPLLFILSLSIEILRPFSQFSNDLSTHTLVCQQVSLFFSLSARSPFFVSHVRTLL